MLSRLSEKFEGLFVVKQTQHTNTRLFLTFCLIFVVMAILPLYFKYEDYNYGKYKVAYQEARSIVRQYHGEHGEYPIGGAVDLREEKSLRDFFADGLTHGRLYYVDLELVPALSALKYRYIIDIDRGTLYTSEHVAYRLERWHLAVH